MNFVHAIASSKATRRILENAVTTIAEHVAESPAEAHAPLMFEAICEAIDRLNVQPPPTKRIDASASAISYLKTMLAEPPSALIGAPSSLGIPIVLDESIPPGWVKIIPTEGEPRWMQVVR